MKIRVNGKDKIIELENEKALLSSTLEFLGYKQNTVVVEVNNLIINSKKWENEINNWNMFFFSCMFLNPNIFFQFEY